MGTIEYRVRPVTRYVVTRYGSVENRSICRTLGEYENEKVAHEVAYAVCRDEHQRLGWPIGDERIKYPQPMTGATSLPVATD